jgi:hypothetical protein
MMYLDKRKPSTMTDTGLPVLQPLNLRTFLCFFMDGTLRSNPSQPPEEGNSTTYEHKQRAKQRLPMPDERGLEEAKIFVEII